MADKIFNNAGHADHGSSINNANPVGSSTGQDHKPLDLEFDPIKILQHDPNKPIEMVETVKVKKDPCELFSMY